MNTMNTELTLSLDKEIIEQTKLYALNRQQSLSALVENYFRFLICKGNSVQHSDISGTIQEFSEDIKPVAKDNILEKSNDAPKRPLHEFIGVLKNSTVFSDDPVIIQRKMRDEWD